MPVEHVCSVSCTDENMIRILAHRVNNPRKDRVEISFEVFFRAEDEELLFWMNVPPDRFVGDSHQRMQDALHSGPRSPLSQLSYSRQTPWDVVAKHTQ